MSKQIEFKDTSALTILMSFLLFITVYLVSTYVWLLLFKTLNSQWQIIICFIIASMAVRIYRKNKNTSNYAKNMDTYTTKLNSYKDFEGFQKNNFEQLFSGYHFVYHGNVKAIVKYSNDKFHIEWKDNLRSLQKQEVINTRQNGMDKIEIVSQFFKTRFKELHFSFDWDNLTLRY